MRETAIEIHQVRAFLAVAEELHFGRAAERLEIAQPPLSRTIRQLEGELGTRLFDRTTRSVTLTPTGAALVEPARAVIEATDAAAESIRKAGAGLIGTIRVGFTTAAGGQYIAQLVRASKERNPGIDFVLETDVYTPDALPRLVDGTLDLALVRADALPTRLEGRAVVRESPVVLLARDHPLANRAELTIADLADEDFIMLPGNPSPPTRELFFHWFFAAGLRPKVVQEAPDSLMIASLVATGLGISISLDQAIAHVDSERLVTVPLAVDHPPMLMQLAHREQDANPALAQVLQTADEALPTVG
ncbi:LysR family transcriptional regulator [Brevibacterium sp. 5221]|uniref:LysR family transcriptional regulator n=1 Tax=Brevibacterium rongguiense TaxID=2695267 RepID=A0A6N9H6W8_9MICO|nr:LysR family transcriptional regulator [Brevibacterium rongguiense]MYM19292.1 LysR family transcriptional regulator [Brevibacterium rongguiense]